MEYEIMVERVQRAFLEIEADNLSDAKEKALLTVNSSDFGNMEYSAFDAEYGD